MNVERRARFEGMRNWFLSDEVAFSSSSVAFDDSGTGDDGDGQPSTAPELEEVSTLISVSSDSYAPPSAAGGAAGSSAAANPRSYRFRSIQQQDRQVIQALHEEWFPVRYQDDFYDDLVQNGQPAERWVSCDDDDERGQSDVHWANGQSSTHSNSAKAMRQSSSSSAAAATSGRALYTCVAVPDDEEESSRICACIVGCFLHAKSHLSPRLRELLLPSQRHSRAFYIMTLGVIPSCRKAGLGSQLVQWCQRLVESDPGCGVLYLHVITFNAGAIRLYEKLGFYRVEEIENYYTIEGRHYNAFLFAKYFHGNRGHRDLFSLFREGARTVWKAVAATLPLVLQYLPRQWSQQPRIRHDRTYSHGD
jgi:ribosomal protein S18 acetylase RimI-like enzyme